MGQAVCDEGTVARGVVPVEARETVGIEDYRDQIEQKLIEERVVKDLDAWLAEARKRTEVVFHEEAFQ